MVLLFGVILLGWLNMWTARTAGMVDKSQYCYMWIIAMIACLRFMLVGV